MATGPWQLLSIGICEQTAEAAARQLLEGLAKAAPALSMYESVKLGVAGGQAPTRKPVATWCRG